MNINKIKQINKEVKYGKLMYTKLLNLSSKYKKCGELNVVWELEVGNFKEVQMVNTKQGEGQCPS